jgi:hypothetical protein
LYQFKCKYFDEEDWNRVVMQFANEKMCRCANLGDFKKLTAIKKRKRLTFSFKIYLCCF